MPQSGDSPPCVVVRVSEGSDEIEVKIVWPCFKVQFKNRKFDLLRQKKHGYSASRRSVFVDGSHGVHHVAEQFPRDGGHDTLGEMVCTLLGSQRCASVSVVVCSPKKITQKASRSIVPTLMKLLFECCP